MLAGMTIGHRDHMVGKPAAGQWPDRDNPAARSDRLAHPPQRRRQGTTAQRVHSHKVRVARDMYASKQYTVAAIARTLGVSRASIYRNLAEPRS